MELPDRRALDEILRATGQPTVTELAHRDRQPPFVYGDSLPAVRVRLELAMAYEELAADVAGRIAAIRIILAITRELIR